jgi:hypothetical protein
LWTRPIAVTAVTGGSTAVAGHDQVVMFSRLIRNAHARLGAGRANPPVSVNNSGSAGQLTENNGPFVDLLIKSQQKG